MGMLNNTMKSINIKIMEVKNYSKTVIII